MEQEPTINSVLTDEHRWIDARLDLFAKHLARGEVLGGPFQEAAPVLRRHIYLEEEVLFPAVESAGILGPTAVMVQEHGHIWKALGTIEELIGARAGAEGVNAAYRAFRGHLDPHGLKEEHVLYPASDEVLDTEAVQEVLRQVKEAKVPSGWVCRALRGRKEQPGG